MGRYSERKATIQGLEQLVVLAAATDEDDWPGVDDDAAAALALHAPTLCLPDLLLLHASVISNRYLGPRTKLPKRPHPFDYILSLGPNEFRQEARMDKASFLQLVEMIKSHTVFSNNAHIDQSPVYHQLLVFLAKLGRFGNGASAGILARHFGLGIGTVHLYCMRCLMAILALERQVVFWPGDSERRTTARRIEQAHGFEGCVGFVDGTLFPVYAKPSTNGEDFYSRKGYYGMAGMLVCDDLRRILYMDLGWPGAVHDMRVWSTSQLGREPDRFMKPHEFLLADSGYAVAPHILPSFKKTRGNTLTREQETLNKHIAGCRYVNEHCIGILKGRFQLLRGMRLDISKPRDAKVMVMYIRAAGVLNNLLLGMSDTAAWHQALYDLDVTNDREPEAGYTPQAHSYENGHARREYHCAKFSVDNGI